MSPSISFSLADAVVVAPVAVDASTKVAIYGLAAAMLGFLGYAIRRFVGPSNFAHTPAGAITITVVLSALSALVPVLQTGHVTAASLVTTLTTAVMSAIGMANPTMAAQARAPLDPASIAAVEVAVARTAPVQVQGPPPKDAA